MAGARILTTVLAGKLDESQRNYKFPAYQYLSGVDNLVDFMYVINRDLFKTRVSFEDGISAELSTGEPLSLNYNINSTVKHIELDQFWQLLKREANKINDTEFFNIDGCIKYSDSKRNKVAIVKDNGVGPYTVFSYIKEIGKFDSFDEALDHAKNYVEYPLEELCWLRQEQIDTLKY